MQNCARIPKYTPIATFLFGQYVTDGTSLSGVFLKCTPTGFEVKLNPFLLTENNSPFLLPENNSFLSPSPFKISCSVFASCAYDFFSRCLFSYVAMDLRYLSCAPDLGAQDKMPTAISLCNIKYNQPIIKGWYVFLLSFDWLIG